MSNETLGKDLLASGILRDSNGHYIAPDLVYRCDDPGGGGCEIYPADQKPAHILQEVWDKAASAVRKVKARLIVGSGATQSTAYKLEVTLKKKP